MFNNSTDVRRFRALAFVGLSALIFLAPAWTYAQTCVDIFAEASVLDVLRESGRFLAPNEVDPHHVLPILNLAKPGTLVSVGTERGFLYAGMSPRVRALALIDMDPAVVYFNRLNVKLLRAARNRGDYLHLRLAADETEWRRRGIVDADTGAIWQWWREKVKYNADSGNASRNFFHA